MTESNGETSSDEKFKGKTALVIDDDDDIAALLSDFLTHLGFQVTKCHDGMQARQWVTTKSFDLIFVDIKIPSLNGLQVAAIARTVKENRATNIYVISGLLTENTRITAQSLKIKHFIDKPVDLAELSQKLNVDFRPKQKTAYDVRVINAFLDAASEIYTFYFQETPQRGKMNLQQQGQPEKGFCTGLIALMGDGFVGSMGLSLTAPFIKKLAETLFQGMDVKYDNDFIADLTGEMCNQVLGKVKINFAQMGISVRIGLPEVITGKNHIIHHKVANPVVCIPIGKGSEIFEIQFVLSKQNMTFEDAKKSDIPASSVLMFD